MFTCLCSHHWVLIILAPREGKVYYMDFMTKSQPRLRTEFISYALDKALFEFASNGSPPTQVKTKFEHVTDFGDRKSVV